MAAEQITQVISQFPPPPQSGVDDEVQFNLKSDAFVLHQATNYTPEVNEWADQANAVSSQVNANAVSAGEDAESAGTSEANAKDSEIAAVAAKDYLEGYAYSFKNRIVNGNFVVEQGDWDRVVSATETSAYDLFYIKWFDLSVNGKATVSTPSLSNGQNALKIQVTTASTSSSASLWTGLYFYIEENMIKDIQDEEATFSFVIETNFSGVLPLTMNTKDNGFTYATEFNVVPGINHIEKTINFPAGHINPAGGTDSGLWCNIAYVSDETDHTATPAQLDKWTPNTYFYGTQDSTLWSKTLGNFIQISELQFEKGSTKTAFEDLPYDVQLVRVKRYYREYLNSIFSDYAGGVSYSCGSTILPDIDFRRISALSITELTAPSTESNTSDFALTLQGGNQIRFFCSSNAVGRIYVVGGKYALDNRL